MSSPLKQSLWSLSFWNLFSHKTNENNQSTATLRGKNPPHTHTHTSLPMTRTYASLLSEVKQILTLFLTAPLKIWTLSLSLVPEVHFWILLRNFSVLLKHREAFCLTLSLTFTFCSVFYKYFLHLCNYFILLHFNKISFILPAFPVCSFV